MPHLSQFTTLNDQFTYNVASLKNTLIVLKQKETCVSVNLCVISSTEYVFLTDSTRISEKMVEEYHLMNISRSIDLLDWNNTGMTLCYYIQLILNN